MTDSKRDTGGDETADERGARPASPAEAKRAAARRRFLRGAATGIVIVTVAHQRAAARANIVASSPDGCISLTGHQPSGRTIEVDSIRGADNRDNSRHKVTRFVCD